MIKVERRAISFVDLTFLPGNPNAMSKAEYAGLVEAIREAGTLLQPVLVRLIETREANRWRYEVVDGEHRAQACREAGVEPVECVVAFGMTDAQARAYRIGMNKRRGALDARKVGEEVRLIASGEELAADILAVIGFARDELDAILSASASVEELLGGADRAGEEDPGPSREPQAPAEKGALLSVRFEVKADRDEVRSALAELDDDPAAALLSLVRKGRPAKRQKGAKRGR